MRFTRKIKLRLNIIAFSAALIFILLAIMTIFNLSALDNAGHHFIKKYTRSYQKQYDAAISNLASNNISLVEKQLDDWSGVLKGDRAYPIKRNVLLEISKKLHQLKQFEKMRRWSMLWFEIDDRDITAKAYYYEALRNISESHDEGSQGLAKIYKDFPRSGTLEKFYFSSLCESGDEEKVDSILSARFPQQKRWQLFWDVGRGFNRKDSLPPFALAKRDDQAWLISTEIVGKPKSLRVDPPPGTSMFISDVVLIVNDREHKISLENIKLNMMSVDGNNLIVSESADPYFSFDVSKYYNNNGSNEHEYKVAISFSVKIITLTCSASLSEIDK